jgi:hypothetical protein
MHILTNIHRSPVAAFVREMGKLKYLSLLKATVGTWAMSTKGTEWIIAIQLVGGHGSGQKNYFFISWT